jgi:hypothetical protein
MTAAVVALVSAGAFGAGALRSQDDDGALRDAIEAQQQQSLDAAGAADAGVEEAEAVEPAPELLAEEELDELVAPVALYPDALLAQVLVAAAFPLQVAKADQLIEASADMSEEELSDAMARQEFDPSVMVLMSGFPTVVSRMADDLDWTDRLGQAMVNQDDDVLAAVQRMRADAEAQGNLTSNDAQVVEEEEGQIYIKPADPEVVYVPTYDPEVVYTTPSYQAPAPYVVQQQSSNPLANPLTAGALAFGGALLVTELFGDDDDNDNNNGWDDYWRGGRPIDWDDRQFYPRPIYRGGGPVAWSRERDRYWDRRADRWRRDDAEAIRAYQLGRQDTLRDMERNAERRAERMREAAREERARAEAQRDRIVDQRRKAVTERRKEQRAEEAAAEQRRKEAAAAAAARRDRAAERERAERKAREDERKAAAARREKRAEAAAAEARKQEAAKRARAEEQARKARDEDQARRRAAERNEAAAEEKARARRRAAEEQQQAEEPARRRAAEEQRSKAAAAQRAEEQKRAEKRRAERQEERKCERNPDAKGCKGGN